MVTGSILTEYFNEESDIDIIILSNIYRNIFIESYYFKEIKMQAIVLPLYDLESVINRDRNLGGGVYINQLHSGKILFDPMGALLNLKKKAEVLYSKGPRSLTRFQFNQGRARITTRLEDLKGSDDVSENIFTILDLYPRIVDLFFQEHKSWAFQGKSASREMKQLDVSFYNDMVESICSLAKSGDKSKAVSLVSKFLSMLGGEVHFYSTREYKEVNDSNIMVVFIGDNGNIFLKQQCEEVEKLMMNSLLSKYSDVKAVGYYNPDARVYRSGLYIICFCDNRKINEELLPLLEMFHLNLYHTKYSEIAKNFYYPYNINPLETFGDTEIQCVLIELLSKIKVGDTQKDINSYSFGILQQFKKLPFFDSNPSLWSKFWSCAYDLFEKSGNYEYLPEEVFRSYSVRAKERCIYKASNWQFYDRIQVCNIEEDLTGLMAYAENFNRFAPILDLNVSKDDNLRNIFLFYLYLVEAIVNVLNVEDKLFLAYLMTKEESDEC